MLLLNRPGLCKCSPQAWFVLRGQTQTETKRYSELHPCVLVTRTSCLGVDPAERERPLLEGKIKSTKRVLVSLDSDRTDGNKNRRSFAP